MGSKDDPTRTDRTSSGSNATSTGNETDDLGRRAYLKLGATAAAAAATGAFATGATANDEEYDVITVPSNTHEEISVSGETFENTLIDVSNPGAAARIIVTNGTVRNVGIRGQQDSDLDAHSWMVVRADSGREVRVEDVYMGDGLDGNYGGGGLLVHPRHAGECYIERVHVAGSGDNGLYGSAPGEAGSYAGNGRVEMRECLSYNNTVSQFRIGTPGSVVEDCVGWVDTRTPEYRNPGASTLSRGIWHWYDTDSVVRNVHIDMNGYGATVVGGHKRGGIDVVDSELAGGALQGSVSTTNVGETPDLEPPEGVPMSPGEAASGGGYSGSSDSTDSTDSTSVYDNLVVIEGAEGDAEASYQFAVDGDVEPVEEEGATVDETISVEDGIASGDVTTDSDAFRFSGEITAFEVDGPVTISLNGDNACLTALERRDHELPADLDHSHMTLHNVGDTPYDVEFSVTGDVVKSSDYDSPLDPTDCIHDHGADGASVEGDIRAGSKKTFYVTGTVDAFETTAANGDARFWVDGEQYDADSVVGTGSPLPDDYYDTPDDSEDGDESDSEDGDEALSNTLVISGVEGDLSRYEFEVSGELAAHEERGTIDWSDRIEDNAAEGYVHDDDVDAYRFSGSLTSFRLLGNATVRLER